MQELEEIYDEHVWRVYAFFAYRLGNRDAAEDLTQATFERAVRAFRRYDARKGSHQTWLMAIANNLLIDHFRRNASSPTRPLEQEDLDNLPASAAPDMSLGLDPELAAALTILSDREREIVALRYGADLTGPADRRAQGPLAGQRPADPLALAAADARGSRGEPRRAQRALTCAWTAPWRAPGCGASGPRSLTPSAAIASSAAPLTR